MGLMGKVLIAQGGGPTAVINQSLVGAVLESRKFSQVTHIYGALNGVEGIVNQEFLDLTSETTRNLELVANSPASALHTTRVKPDEKYCAEIFKVLKAHGVRYFYYIGGNDSSDTVRIVNEYANVENYEFRAIHIPKTIDNDLVINDHTPGYGSAAKYVSSLFVGLNLDNIALKGVHLAIVMGRHAGFLTAASALGRKYPDDGPHLVYLPERKLNIESFLQDVKSAYEKYGRCIIAMSEGVKNEDGEPIMKSLVDDIETDAHGNIQLSGSGLLGDAIADLIRTKLNIKKVRADTLGYAQRTFIDSISDVDALEAREVGEKAAHFAIRNNVDGSIVIDRVGDYAVSYRLVPVEEIGGKTKYMPDDFINVAGNDVTKKFVDYAKPLIGSGILVPSRLMAEKVSKIKL